MSKREERLVYLKEVKSKEVAERIRAARELGDLENNEAYDMAKIEQEFSEYKQNLVKNFTKEEIIDKSYETTFKEETVSILEGLILGRNEIKALLNTEKPLDRMYNKYMNIETSMLDKMTDIVRDIVDDLDKEFMKKREKVR